MTRNVFIFLGTFVVGALVALVARAAVYHPYAGRDTDPSGGGHYAAMVSNPLTPASSAEASKPGVPHAAPAPAKPAADPHAGHGAAAASQDHSAASHATGHPSAAAPAAGKPVNSLCAICGMEVDPNVATLEYKGSTIGFGCKMCPPKFKADPDRYGPYYLRNEVAPN